MKDNSKQIDHSGSYFDEFLREEGMLEEVEAVAIKRVIAWQAAARKPGEVQPLR